MNPETNRIEYKQELTDDLVQEAISFLNYHEGGVFIGKFLLLENANIFRHTKKYFPLCINRLNISS